MLSEKAWGRHDRRETVNNYFVIRDCDIRAETERKLILEQKLKTDIGRRIVKKGNTYLR